METTTQFPVHQGTVVEVTCSYSDAANEGDSEVTCISGTDFTFSKEPSCSTSGKQLLLILEKIQVEILVVLVNRSRFI